MIKIRLSSYEVALGLDKNIMTSRALKWMSRNQQPLFNIGMSFLIFNFAGQVYQGKLERSGLANDIKLKEGALVKMERAAADPSKTGEQLRRDIRRFVAEARGVADQLEAAETYHRLEAEAEAKAKDAVPSKNIVI